MRSYNSEVALHQIPNTIYLLNKTKELGEWLKDLFGELLPVEIRMIIE